MLAARQLLAGAAGRARPAQLAPALPGRLAEPAGRVTVRPTNRFRAEQPVPSLLADALEGLVAVAVLTAGQRDALVAAVAVEA